MRFPVACAAVSLTLLNACGPASNDPVAGDDPTTQDPRAGVEVVHDSVDATLAVNSFVIDSETEMSILIQDLRLHAEGSFDYAGTVGDITFEVEQQGSVHTVSVLADGDDAWVRHDGDRVPPVPDGKEWVETSKAPFEAGDDQQAGTLGPVLLLLAAEEVTEGETDERDGVVVREFTTTVAYADAIDAAGDRADELRSSFGLTGDAEETELELTAWVGDDDIIRDFEVEALDGGAMPVEASVDLELREVNQPVDVPDVPDPDTVLTGPQAEEYLGQFEG